ncbi:MAG: hypothetical protein K2G49_06335 [Muribaculum sp.]|nr:hypothetical protein [Muribaculum sp.]
MQCRGEWKLARGDSNPGICAWACHADGRATSQSPLQLRDVTPVHLLI